MYDADAVTPPKSKVNTDGKKVDAHPLGWLPLTAEAGLALQGLHRKPLMLQRFPYSRVNMLAEIGDRRFRRDSQHQRHDPGDHPGKCLRLQMHSPTYRKVEYHLRAFGAPPAHQQCARRGDDR